MDGALMRAAEALRAAQTAGLAVRVEGKDLVLQASAPPPQELLGALSELKPEIIQLLRAANDLWSVQDWLAFFDARAGIAEFDGDLLRAEAEALALTSCVTEWLNRNPLSWMAAGHVEPVGGDQMIGPSGHCHRHWTGEVRKERYGCWSGGEL
jgi:hypothetical protein